MSLIALHLCAIAQSVPAPIITLSLMARFVSRQQESFSAQVAAALRNQFGGHAVRTADAIEGQVAAEAYKSVAPSTPSMPATPIAVSSEHAAEAVMDRTEQAERAGEQTSDTAHVVKDIQGTAQGIYKTDGKG